MTRLAKDYRVLFINNLGMRIPSVIRDKHAVKKMARKLRSMAHFLRKVNSGMYVFSPLSLPILGSSVGKRLNTFSVLSQVKLAMILLGIREPIFYIGCLPAFDIVKKLRAKYLVYERTDLFEEMPGTNKDYIASLNRELTESADLILFVNEALWKEGTSRNKNSLLIGHGVDFSLFVDATKSEYVPEDMVKIPKPIVGFYGDISDKTSNFDLLESIAEKLPDMSLVLVGPISADVSRLRRYKNIYFLGQKPYDQVPFYGKEFDVAIMPWNKNRWIKFCNPIKIKEYLALGKPIVSTYYPEIKPYSDIVHVAKDNGEFISYIHKAVTEQDPKKVEERRKRIQNETWDSKVEQIKAFIEKGLN